MKYIAIIFFILIHSVAQANDWYLGKWKVSDALFPGISAMDTKEAKVWFGSIATYTKDKVTFRKEICKKPVYKVETLTKDQFYSSYKTTFDKLHIEGEVVEILHVGSSLKADWTAPSATIIRANKKFGYILWDGVFFKVDKIIH